MFCTHVAMMKQNSCKVILISLLLYLKGNMKHHLSVSFKFQKYTLWTQYKKIVKLWSCLLLDVSTKQLNNKFHGVVIQKSLEKGNETEEDAKQDYTDTTLGNKKDNETASNVDKNLGLKIIKRRKKSNKESISEEL